VEKIELGELTLREEDGTWHLHVAGKYYFSFQVPEHAQMLREIISIRGEGHKALQTKDLLTVRLPVDRADCNELLDELTTVKSEIATLQEKVKNKEEEADELVCALYGLSLKDRKILTQFLLTF